MTLHIFHSLRLALTITWRKLIFISELIYISWYMLYSSCIFYSTQLYRNRVFSEDIISRFRVSRALWQDTHRVARSFFFVATVCYKNMKCENAYRQVRRRIILIPMFNIYSTRFQYFCFCAVINERDVFAPDLHVSMLCNTRYAIKSYPVYFRLPAFHQLFYLTRESRHGFPRTPSQINHSSGDRLTTYNFFLKN